MAPSPARRWQRLEHDERRAQILGCARRLFSENTYDSVSTSEIAREAGVARSLLHHYFGSKRELYLEVVRSLVQMPANPVPLGTPDSDIELVIGESVERWLSMLQANRGTWLAAIGARGLGRDREVEQILEQAREQAADRLIEAAQTSEGVTSPAELHGVIRAYSGFAEAASIEWLLRGRLSREQVRVLLIETFLTLIRDVLPAVARAGAVHNP
jgi:AcrR family transcriptional regulator